MVGSYAYCELYTNQIAFHERAYEHPGAEYDLSLQRRERIGYDGSTG